MIINLLSDLPCECHQRRRLVERHHDLLGVLAKHDEGEFLVARGSVVGGQGQFSWAI
jgi:hypothetical protein